MGPYIWFETHSRNLSFCTCNPQNRPVCQSHQARGQTHRDTGLKVPFYVRQSPSGVNLWRGKKWREHWVLVCKDATPWQCCFREKPHNRCNFISNKAVQANQGAATPKLSGSRMEILKTATDATGLTAKLRAIRHLSNDPSTKS